MSGVIILYLTILYLTSSRMRFFVTQLDIVSQLNYLTHLLIILMQMYLYICVCVIIAVLFNRGSLSHNLRRWAKNVNYLTHLLIILMHTYRCAYIIMCLCHHCRTVIIIEVPCHTTWECELINFITVLYRDYAHPNCMLQSSYGWEYGIIMTHLLDDTFFHPLFYPIILIKNP